jgi:hypothetical protein
VYLYYDFVILMRNYDFDSSYLGRKSENNEPGLCSLTGSFWPVPFAVLASATGPGVLSSSVPLLSSTPSPLTILSPVCPRCCSLSFFFSPFFCESSAQVKEPNPYHSRLSLLHPAHSPACPFERLVKNHDDRQRRLSSIATLLYSCYIAPIAPSTWHATLFRHSRLVFRSLVTLLHPKSLHFRV